MNIACCVCFLPQRHGEAQRKHMQERLLIFPLCLCGFNIQLLDGFYVTVKKTTKRVISINNIDVTLSHAAPESRSIEERLNASKSLS